jgi:HAD superfamily hydrolase (TIGR01544 family)
MSRATLLAHMTVGRPASVYPPLLSYKLMEFSALCLVFIGGLTARRKHYASLEISADPSALKSKFNALLQGGFASLHVVIDWDRTVTTQYCRGAPGDSCHGIIERWRGEDFSAAASVLNAYYYPLETSEELTQEEKVPYMRQWYTKVNELLVKSGMTRGDLAEDVRRGNFELRPGVLGLFRACERHGFPVTIFSAGIGDVILEVMRQRYGPLPPNLRVVSNRMVWDEEGVCVGFSPSILHPFNKNFMAMDEFFSAEDRGFYAAAMARPNVLVCGDGKGDAAMAVGLHAATTVLKCGLLNYVNPPPTEAQKRSYLDLFDVVCLGDSPLFLITRLLSGMEGAVQ